jgi:hypothetical protein
MNKIAFSAFSDELRRIQVADADTPHDYLETRVAALTKLGGLGVGKALVGGATKLLGPASRAGKFLGQHGGTIGHGIELGGLGMLAAPSVGELRRSQDPHERFKAKAELAGLGTLAITPGAALAGHLLGH